MLISLPEVEVEKLYRPGCDMITKFLDRQKAAQVFVLGCEALCLGDEWCASNPGLQCVRRCALTQGLQTAVGEGLNEGGREHSFADF